MADSLSVRPPVDVMAGFFDGLPVEAKAAAVQALVSSSATKVLGVEVLRALGIPTERALSASLEMLQRGEIPVISVRYAVHGDVATDAIAEVLKTWAVVPRDEAAVAGIPAPASHPQTR